MTNWLNQLHEQQTNIDELGYSLESLSKLFRRLGNDKIADEIREYAVDAHEIANIVKLATSEAVDFMYKSAEQSSLNMVRAALAGIEISEVTK